MSLSRKAQYIWTFVSSQKTGELDRGLVYNKYTVTPEIRAGRQAVAEELRNLYWKSQAISLVATVCLRLAMRRLYRPGLPLTAAWSLGFGLAIGTHYGYDYLEKKLSEEMAEVVLQIEAERKWVKDIK